MESAVNVTRAMRDQGRASVRRLLTHYPLLTADAIVAMEQLYSGVTCTPSEEVRDELGRLGLAYLRDLRSRSSPLLLTLESTRFITVR